MSILDYILIFIVVILILLLISTYKKLSYICKVLDQVLDENLNQRVRLQNHIKPLNILAIKINLVIEKFQQVHEKSRVSEESRKKMISNISHDLRTPLTSMLGYMELILEDRDIGDDSSDSSVINNNNYDENQLSDTRKTEYLRIVYNKGNYLYNLMEEFFQVSKLDSNDISLEIKKINVSEIIRQNIISFFNEIKKLNIEPEINIPEEDVYALGDEKALNRILSNLINNAIKYGSEGTRIGISLVNNEENVSIQIYDNGVGIPENEIDYVFDRLYTVEKSRKLNNKSSGIGLTIVKKLVKALGGNISVSSIPFEKTAFTFKLPKH